MQYYLTSTLVDQCVEIDGIQYVTQFGNLHQIYQMLILLPALYSTRVPNCY